MWDEQWGANIKEFSWQSRGLITKDDGPRFDWMHIFQGVLCLQHKWVKRAGFAVAFKILIKGIIERYIDVEESAHRGADNLRVKGITGSANDG